MCPKNIYLVNAIKQPEIYETTACPGVWWQWRASSVDPVGHFVVYVPLSLSGDPEFLLGITKKGKGRPGSAVPWCWQENIGWEIGGLVSTTGSYYHLLYKQSSFSSSRPWHEIVWARSVLRGRRGMWSRKLIASEDQPSSRVVYDSVHGSHPQTWGGAS